LPITAKLVYDGGPDIHIPSEMGTPSNNQLQGTTLENLSELACRVCYDSLGKGRSSTELHKHIKEVSHLSVYEHPTITVEIPNAYQNYWRTFINRPGTWLELKGPHLHVTYNLRTIIEWDKYTTFTNTDYQEHAIKVPSNHIRHILRSYATRLAPTIIDREQWDTDITPPVKSPYFQELYGTPHSLVPSEEHGPHSAWISIYISCSRGCSHELVRHGNETAISQRSTRYVDETESPYITHPLITDYLNNPITDTDLITRPIHNAEETSKISYKNIVSTLTTYMTRASINKLTARKAARGAARGYLGNALQTELIFSASAHQWLHMLQLRCSEHADPEIRVLFATILNVLQHTRYNRFFKDLTLSPSPDGIGSIITQPQENTK